MPNLQGQDDALVELLAARQWKQAYNICEKKLKKAHSENLVVKKISILLAWPDHARNQQGLKELGLLLERKPPVTDLESLLALDPLTKTWGEDEPRLRQIWQRAASVSPQDEQLHKVWYRTKFEEGDLRGAQQASMLWMKHFPKNRGPYFLYILTMHLVSELPSTSESERKLLQTLAYNFLSKAAKRTPKDEEGRSGRVIDNLEDLLLLVRVYQAQGNYGEAISIVEDARAGSITGIGKNQWELVRKLIDLFESANRWEELFSLCDRLLDEAQQEIAQRMFEASGYPFGSQGDDWKVWQGLIKAASKISTREQPRLAEKLILEYPSGKDGSRNARFALLEFYSRENATGTNCQDKLLAACYDYFRDFSAKFSCFQDLKPYFAHLEREKQEKLLSIANDLAWDSRPKATDSDSTKLVWITSEINALKLEYHTVVSRDDNSYRQDLLTDFISNCLRLYKLSLDFDFQLPISDRRPGDDAGMLAAMGLVRLYRTRARNVHHSNALLRSVIVLEHVLLHSKHNYDALLILVRLYMFLGAGSLAIERYSRLSIKNIQHATISWVLYTRISTIHPHPATFPAAKADSYSRIDPLVDMQEAIKWHQNAQNLSEKSVCTMQENGQWNMSLDALATQKHIWSSFPKYLLIAETKRIQRHRSSTHDLPDQLQMNIPSRTKDTRDKSAFPNFEATGQSTFEEILPMAATEVEPNDKWVEQQLFLARFWDILHNNGRSSISEDQLAAMKDSSATDPEPFTTEEYGSGNVLYLLQQIYFFTSQESRQHEAQLSESLTRNLIEGLEAWITKGSRILADNIESGMNASSPLTADLNIPLWNYFHGLYTHLDVCRYMKPVLDYLTDENRKTKFAEPTWLAARVAAIRKECKSLSGNVLRSATNLRGKLRGPAALDEIKRGVLGHSNEIEPEDTVGKELRCLGNDSLIICRNIQESWIEALDGVIQTKIT